MEVKRGWVWMKGGEDREHWFVLCNNHPSLGFPSPHTHFCISDTLFIPHTLTLEHSPSLSHTHNLLTDKDLRQAHMHTLQL